MCVRVCPFAVGTLVFEPFDLDFGMRVDLDLGYPGIVGQGRRSKSRSTSENCLRSPV